MRFSLVLFFFIFHFYSVGAQQVLPARFVTLSDSFGLQWPGMERGDQRVKFYEPEAVLGESFALGIHQPKEKYRVLVLFKPEGQPPIPHVKATLRANHFSDNTDESLVAIHTFTEEGLEPYGADWGAVYYFRPKPALPAYRDCQMVSLFKLDVGTVHLLYLFDDFSPEVEEMVWNPVFEATVAEN